MLPTLILTSEHYCINLMLPVKLKETHIIRVTKETIQSKFFESITVTHHLRSLSLIFGLRELSEDDIAMVFGIVTLVL